MKPQLWFHEVHEMSYLDKCNDKEDLFFNKLKPSRNLLVFILSENHYLAYTLNDMKEIFKKEKKHYIYRKDVDRLEIFFYLPNGIRIDSSLSSCFNNNVNTMKLVESVNKFYIGKKEHNQIYSYYRVIPVTRSDIESDEPSTFDETINEPEIVREEPQVNWDEVKKQQEARKNFETERKQRQLKKEEEKWSDEKFCLEAVKEDGFNLQSVRNQTEEICREAVKNRPYAFDFVKNPTNSIYEAIKNEHPIIYCKPQTYEIVLEPVKYNPYAYKFTKSNQ